MTSPSAFSTWVHPPFPPFLCGAHAHFEVKQVEFSNPPSPTSVNSPNVLFRATHPVTLLLEDGSLLLYVTQPRYKFANVSTRRKFQELIRARTLIDEVMAVEVFPLFRNDDGSGGLNRCSTGGTTNTSSKATSSSSSSSSTFSLRSILGMKTDGHQKRKEEERCLARCEPLQIWQLPGCGVLAATMTFVADAEQLVRKGGGARGVSNQYRVLEWHAGDLAVGGALRVVMGGASSAPWAVEMWWAEQCAGSAPGVKITFGTKNGEFDPMLCSLELQSCLAFFLGRHPRGRVARGQRENVPYHLANTRFRSKTVCKAVQTARLGDS
jgi:hypothetical protein